MAKGFSGEIKGEWLSDGVTLKWWNTAMLILYKNHGDKKRQPNGCLVTYS